MFVKRIDWLKGPTSLPSPTLPSHPRLLRLESDVSKQRERLVLAREESQQVAERHEEMLALVEQLEVRSVSKHKARKDANDTHCDPKAKTSLIFTMICGSFISKQYKTMTFIYTSPKTKSIYVFVKHESVLCARP